MKIISEVLTMLFVATLVGVLLFKNNQYREENKQLKVKVYQDSLEIAWYREHCPKWNNYKFVK